MPVDDIPGVEVPAQRDRLGVALAEEQLQLIEDLREVRLRRNLSVTEVAEAMGVDPSQISRFESGSTNPTMASIRRYARNVGALVKYVVEDTEAVRHIDTSQ